MSTPTQELATTYGWDTAFGIRVDDVNASIARAGSSPSSFSATGKDPLSGVAFGLSGRFGDWQITLGGSGSLLHMATPVPTMTLTAPGRSSTFTGGQFVIEVALEYLQMETPPAVVFGRLPEAGGTFHQLKVKQSAAAGERAVTVMTSSFAEASYPEFQPDVQQALQSWFEANLADFEHVFATVNLNRSADRGQFEFLLPTAVSYAYVDGPTQDESVLGVLCMTAGRAPDGLVQQVSPNVIPEGSRAGFLISPERFLSQMVQPSMPLVYKGCSASDLVLSADALSLALEPGTTVQLQDVVHQGKSYSPELQQLEIRLTAGHLTVESLTMVSPSWEIYTYSHDIFEYAISLHQLPDGKQTLWYSPVGTPVHESYDKEGVGVEITKILADIIGAIIVIVVGVATEGAGLVPAALIVGVLLGIGSEIPDMIEAANTEQSPPIDLLLANASDPIVWADQQDFKLDQVALNGSLQMGGTPSFAKAQGRVLRSA